jgi:calcineurin-like phosphoesterase family protein
MNVFFTADHHFGHNNVIAYDKRPFSGLHEMHEELIRRHNEVVRKEDLVYMLGDIVWHKNDGDACIPRLNGNLIPVGGGHDHSYFKQKNCPIVHFKRDKYELYLCHFPLLSWPGLGHGIYHVHGHSHGNGPTRPNALDVGVNVWNYYPVDLDTVKKYFADNKEKT